MTSPYYCATAARRREDPLIGTASPARRWLLVEYAGPWAPRALESRGLAGKVAAALHQTAMQIGGRAVLIRRPGRRSVPAEQSWAVVDAGGAQQWGRWSRSEDLLDAVEVFRSGPDSSRKVATAPERPVLLVCTHGLHDVCCAVRGRPVAAALAAQWPEQTWECSHIGGDRFAANVLVVPDGTCYGRLDAVSAPRVVQGHLSGRIDVEHLRGFSTEPPVVQVAMAAVLDTSGSDPIVGNLRAQSVAAAGSDQWRVRLQRDAVLPDVEVTVRRTTRPPAQLTCAAAGDSAAYEWTVVGLRELGREAG